MKKVVRHCCCVLAFCTAVMGCSELEAESMYKTVNSRGLEYRMPTEYMLPDLPSAMVPRGPAMDQDDGVNLEIPLTDLGVAPLPHEMSTGNADTVRVLLYGPSAFKPANEYGLNPAAWNAWAGAEQYRNRVIIKDEKTGFYRVLWRKEAKSWEYFKEPPPEFGQAFAPKWVAGCYLWGREPEAEDMSNVGCKVQLSSEWGDADISFTGRYINQVDDILEAVRKKIKEWAVSAKAAGPERSMGSHFSQPRQ